MTEYQSLFEEDEIMQDVWKRKAEVSKMYERYKNDPEGLRREQDARLAQFGFRLAPTGDEDGTSVLVPIETVKLS
ncbi:MAG: hypothetical protein LBG22_09080 [Treponema sp.]|jgi:hypothetical protein|nr:hypothetical protein [Treponema sp.]